MDQAKHDIQFWIDAHDVLVQEQPNRFRMAIDRAFLVDKKDALFFAYNYSYDDQGICTSILKRERVIDRRGRSQADFPDLFKLQQLVI